ncbi:hypothetical protein GCM10029963_33410 [Micromonospora andamanensis]
MEAFRTLPLRVPLAQRETLHSWLLRLAHRNGMPLLRLAPVLGFGDRLRVPHNYALSWRLPPPLLRRIESQTGLAPGALDAAVLDRFEPLGWKPIPGSRYCTRCLAESGGIWDIGWQLPYTFACRRHRCLLAAICPGCGRAPHGADLSLRAGLHPRPAAFWAPGATPVPATRTCSTIRRNHCIPTTPASRRKPGSTNAWTAWTPTTSSSFATSTRWRPGSGSASIRPNLATSVKPRSPQ